MEKPKPKKEVSIFLMLTTARIIVMNTTKDAIEDFKEFGVIKFYRESNQYWLTVDSRYDFDEIVKYIKGYGE